MPEDLFALSVFHSIEPSGQNISSADLSFAEEIDAVKRPEACKYFVKGENNSRSFPSFAFFGARFARVH
jgi:hypothetical protein